MRYACANIDSANTSGGSGGVSVCVLYINTHINLNAYVSSWLFVWVFFFLCLLFFTTTCVLVCIIHSDYLSSAVCLTAGAASFDCIDLVLLHAVMKDEK